MHTERRNERKFIRPNQNARDIFLLSTLIFHKQKFLDNYLFSEPQSDEDKEVRIPVGERTLLKQPGDGHCLIHSVREGLRHSKVNAVPSADGLLQMVTNEVLNNLSFYSNWTNEGSDIREELKRYVEDRAYGTDSSDIVVNALANSLCVTIRILELGLNGSEYTLHTLPQTPGRRKEHPRAVIDVLKTGEHYDALVPKNTTLSGKFRIISFSIGSIGHLPHIRYVFYYWDVSLCLKQKNINKIKST